MAERWRMRARVCGAHWQEPNNNNFGLSFYSPGRGVIVLRLSVHKHDASINISLLFSSSSSSAAAASLSS